MSDTEKAAPDQEVSRIDGLTSAGVGGKPGIPGRLIFEYPRAVYHIMAGGDGGKWISPGKEDHLSFLIANLKDLSTH